MDNGPELIAWALRDWCRLACTGTIYIEPGSPWENPYLESFNGRVRNELLNTEEFGSLAEAQVITEAWRIEHNTYRPHSALGGIPPAKYAEQWTTQSQHSHSGWITKRGPVIPTSPMHDGTSFGGPLSCRGRDGAPALSVNGNLTSPSGPESPPPTPLQWP